MYLAHAHTHRHIHVLDGFLPAPLAKELRGVFDDRFSAPREGSADRYLRVHFEYLVLLLVLMYFRSIQQLCRHAAASS
jgi:hypothetical protein